jgi:hypothetical protein
MPIKRKQGETKDEFITRCIPIEIKSGKSSDQAAAICYSTWDEKQLSAVKRIRNKKYKAGMPHYTSDGILWTGPTHKDASGRLMTGETHTEDSEYLYHEDELKNLSFESYTDYPKQIRGENFEKIRVGVLSSNVDRMMWNSETLELVIRFNDGSTYTYVGVDEKRFLDVSEGNAAPKTKDYQVPPRWIKDQKPSVGAAVHKWLIKKGFVGTEGGTFR